METKTKVCIVCNTEKPLDAYYRKASSKDGHRNMCKVCEESRRPKKGPQTKEQRRESQLKVSEKKREAMKSFLQANSGFMNKVADANKKAIKATNQTDGTVLNFSSAVDAESYGYCAKSISRAIRFSVNYKGLKWEFVNEI